MRFKVIGADRNSGADREIVIEAVDVESASAKANAKGLMVAECTALIDDGTVATKECPFCAETINAKAIKCRWCGEMLKEATPAPPPLPAGTASVMRCPECHENVPDGVATCPHCGYPIAQEPARPAPSATCRLTVIVSIGKLWRFNLTKDTGSIELGGQVVNGPAKSGFSCQFALPPGEHILKTSMDGGAPGKFRINLPEPGDYELSLGMNQMGGTLFGTPKLAVKRVK